MKAVAGIKGNKSLRKQPWEIVQESQERYRHLVEALPAAIYTCDAEGRVTLYNKAAVALWGQEPKIGTDLWCGSWRLYRPDGTPMALDDCPMAVTIREGRPIRGQEIVIERPDGTRRNVLPHPEPIFDSTGAVVGAVNMLTDITEHKRSEAALREAHRLLADKATHLESLVRERTAKLQETIGELESFSYSISHDMRAPLRAMQSFAKILEEDCGEKIGPVGKDHIRRIIGGADRMDRLIRDVLTYSRVSRAEFSVERVPLETLLKGILESYPIFQPPGAEIELEGPFPNVIANHAALTQCISNLLGNAVKFVAPGVVPRVRVWVETHNDRVRLLVQDNGIGVPKEGRDKIFGIFQRLSTGYEGTGIGLAVVKKGIERMGGRVGFESEEGHGSTFWLELKAA